MSLDVDRGNHYMMVQLDDPGDAPAADGGGGGATSLTSIPLTLSYVSPVDGGSDC